MIPNKFINSAHSKRNEQGLWSIIDVFIILPFVYFMLSQPVIFLLQGFNNYEITSYTLLTLKFSGINLILNFSIMILSVWVTIFFTEKKSILTLGLNGTNRIRKYIFGFYIGFMMMTLITFLIIFTGGGKVDPSFLDISGVKAFPTIFIMLVGWIVQGAAEEILTRGYILPKLSYRFSLFWGVLISSLTFSMLHLFNAGIDFLPFINITLFGIFAAFYSLYEEGILGVCALHSSWNFFQGNIYGFLVSGQSPKGGSLIGIIPSDKTIVNGGSFGPEGGLIVTVVLISGIIWFVYLLYRKEKAGGFTNKFKFR